MLKMKMGDGSIVTVTGEEAKKAAGSLSKVIYEHSKIAEIHRLTASVKKDTDAIRKDTRFLVNTVPTRVREDVVRISIGGARLAQFERVRAFMRNHPSHSLYGACQVAWRKEEGGYPSVRSLHRFCLAHYGMLA